MFKKSFVLNRNRTIARAITKLPKCSSAAERLKEDSRGLSFHANDAGRMCSRCRLRYTQPQAMTLRLDRRRPIMLERSQEPLAEHDR